MIINTRRKKQTRRKPKCKKLSIAEQQERRLKGLDDNIVFKGRRIKFSHYSENNSFDFKSGAYEVDTLFGISGIYFLLDEGLNVVYIGESIDCSWRIGQHFKDDNKQFKFFKVYKFNSTDAQRIAIERKLIKRYNPIFNKQHNRFNFK